MLPVVLRNTGPLSAIVRVAIAPSAAFELPGGERHIALAPNEVQAISVAFRPGTAGRHTHQVSGSTRAAAPVSCLWVLWSWRQALAAFQNRAVHVHDTCNELQTPSWHEM